MNNLPVKRFTVAIVPSWLNELVNASTDLTYKDLLSYYELSEQKAKLLTEEQILIYVLTQQYLQAFTEKAFDDQKSLSERDDNQEFIRSHTEALNRVSEKLKIESGFANAQSGKVKSIGSVNFLAKEYYQPLLMNGDTLLLVGSSTPIYENNRAFYNATIEEIATAFDYNEFRFFDIFKHYLRHSTSEK